MQQLAEKTLANLTSADIELLLGWPESLTLDYKQALSFGMEGWDQRQKVETSARDALFKEVVAFANTAGGHLILGVKEDPVSTEAVQIVSLSKCHDLADRLGKMAQQIDPPIPGLEIVGVPFGDDGRGVVVFRSPASRHSPHRSTDRHCYVRRDSRSEPISMREIGELFLASRSRREVFEAEFERSLNRGRLWCKRGVGQNLHAIMWLAAVPIDMQFELGRLYPPDEFVKFNKSIPCLVNKTPVASELPYNLFRHATALRGATKSEGDDQACVFSIYSSGVVEFGFRLRTGQNEDVYLPLSWLACAIGNIMRAADSLRKLAGYPSAEYGLEASIESSALGKKPKLLAWFQGYGRDVVGEFEPSDLTLPMVSFRALTEGSEVITTVINDLVDSASGQNSTPYEIQISL